MLGYIGVSLLLIAYLFLVVKEEWFIPTDIAASFILTIYAISLKDIPFTIVNGFITGLLVIKYIKNVKSNSNTFRRS